MKANLRCHLNFNVILSCHFGFFVYLEKVLFWTFVRDRSTIYVKKKI